MSDLVCQQPGCAGSVHAKALCHRHYRQALRDSKTKALCACGCGALTAYTYKHGHHTRLFTTEEQSRRGRQNDGSALRDSGEGKTYRKIGQRHEHRSVAERMLGRALVRGEIVHHINGDKRDNRPENLQVMSQSEHLRLHMLGWRNAT